jgi:hypothetical protein
MSDELLHLLHSRDAVQCREKIKQIIEIGTQEEKEIALKSVDNVIKILNEIRAEKVVDLNYIDGKLKQWNEEIANYSIYPKTKIYEF